jgi:Tol biopolymer transport system component
MPIAAGTMLGPYEIVSQLGAGGMGEVYRATDKRLDRTVAIKVLPAEFSANAQLKMRFEREARAISQLNHPNICTLHDIGESNGLDYLVMEHLEGEVLLDRIARGAIPLADVLRYSIQIADALEKAHRSGIVHRDLKPGNIMLTKSGAKLLDFGLAKALEPSSASGVTAGVTHLLTEQKPLTDQGTIIGTVQYMSPEQLEGRDVDARSDIFAFGIVMYEMLTGRRAFSGKSKASLIAAILATEPQPISASQPLTPPAIERVIAICLQKDPDDRWQSAHDVKLELQGISEAPAGAVVVAPRRRGMQWPLIATAIALAAAIAFIVYDRTEMHPPPATSRFMIAPPEARRFNPFESPVALSPEGTRMLVRVDGDGNTLAVRSFDSFEFVPVSGTNDAYDAFWSADGKQIGFFGMGKLRRVDIAGGSPRIVAAAGDSRGGSWGVEDTIIFAPSLNGPILKVKTTGGPTEAVTKLDATRKETGHWRPNFLPDGKHFVFTAKSNDAGESGVYAGSIDGMTPKRLLDLDTSAIYASGYLLYADGNVLYAQPFDTSKLATTGDPAVVAQNVELNRLFGAPGYSASGDTLVYHPKGSVDAPRLTRFDRATGSRSEITAASGRNLDLSRDGMRIALEKLDSDARTSDIWIYDISRGTSTRLSHDAGPDGGPVWSPEGDWVVWTAYRAGSNQIVRRRSAGTGEEEVVFSIKSDEMAKRGWFGWEVTDWSNDGRMLLLEVYTTASRNDLGTLDLSNPAGSFRIIQNTPYDENSPRFSPDARWIAYTSNENGVRQAYVQPYPATGAKWQISTDGGESTRWRRDGRELFYTAPDNKIMSVPITAQNGQLTIGKPVPILEGTSLDVVVTADGQTFYVASAETATTPPMRVIANWTQTLKAR